MNLNFRQFKYLIDFFSFGSNNNTFYWIIFINFKCFEIKVQTYNNKLFKKGILKIWVKLNFLKVEGTSLKYVKYGQLRNFKAHFIF